MRLNQFLFFLIDNTVDINSLKFSGDNGIEVTPDPIPNSEVKLYSADGTVRETSMGE